MNALEFAPSVEAESGPSNAFPSNADVDIAVITGHGTLTCRANREAFEGLFRQYSDQIFSFQFRLVGNIEDARDLTQKTFLKVWENLPTLHDESKFIPWLYKIARNVAYDHWRSTKKISVYSWDDVTEQQSAMSGSAPEEEAMAAELIRLALAALTPKYRACLLLHILYGFSFQEIAGLLGIKRDSVVTYICYARNQFRQAYKALKQE